MVKSCRANSYSQTGISLIDNVRANGYTERVEQQQKSNVGRIAFIGNYLPRQCGIATFTTDLCQAVAVEYPEATCLAVPVNDTPAGYAYPAEVRFELAEQELASYQRAADFLHVNNVGCLDRKRLTSGKGMSATLFSPAATPLARMAIRSTCTTAGQTPVLPWLRAVFGRSWIGWSGMGSSMSKAAGGSKTRRPRAAEI